MSPPQARGPERPLRREPIRLPLLASGGIKTEPFAAPLLDLSAILGVASEAIYLKGRLGLAFGARGTGRLCPL